MKALKYISTLLMMILFLSNTYCSTVTWTGGNGYWEDANSWDTGNLPSYDDSVIIPSGIVTIDNYATARNIHIQGGELKVYGNLILQIDQALPGGFLNGLRIDAGTSFYNTGLVVILEYAYVPGFARLIHNYGAFINDSKGSIHLNGASYTGIFNSPGSSFTNYGSINMENMDSGIYSIADIYNYGDIDINSTDYSISMNELFYNSSSATLSTNNRITINSSAVLNNYGDIEIDYEYSGGMALGVGGKLTSQKYSSISIEGSFVDGIYVYSSGEMRVKGSLQVISAGLYSSGIYSHGLFVNHQTGNITTTTGIGVTILAGASCLNYGNWVINDAANGASRSLKVEGSFNNRPKGKLTLQNDIITETGSTLNNQGHMFIRHTNDLDEIDGNFNNTACLNDLHGILPTINNSSIIVEPLNVSPQVNVPIPNALNLGNNLGATVLAWYTTASGNTQAGSYNSNSNTFTPNANAVGLSSLYVRTKINAGGVKRRHEIQFDDPVIALSKNESHEIQNQETFTSSISTYPNPASDYIIVSSSNKENQLSTISLIDLGGQIVYSADCDNREECKIDIPENIPNGLYFIQVKSKEGGMRETRTIKVFR